MKNLNFLFSLLLFPLIYLKRLPIHSRLIHNNITLTSKRLFVLPLLFSLLSTINVLADIEVDPSNDICISGVEILSISTDTEVFQGTIETSNAAQNKTGIDYYKFSAPADGNISIIWENTFTSSKTASFLVGTACDDNSKYNGFAALSLHTVSAFSVLEGDEIYLKIYNGEGKTYNLTIDFNATTEESTSDLVITKTDNRDPVQISEDFTYTIDIINKGSEDAIDVNVTDTLPTGMDVNITTTDNDSNGWSCSESGSILTGKTVVCVVDENITAGATSTITLHVTAPLTGQTVINHANVTGSIDGNVSDANTTESTRIIAEASNADNLCYIEDTIANYNDNNATRDAVCKQKGNFFYGEGNGNDPDCEAKVIIVADTNGSIDDLVGVVVYKMYAPDLSNNGIATTSLTLPDGIQNSGGKQDLTIDEYTSYGQGYVVDIATISHDSNFTITDIGTDKNPRIDGIAMYGDYTFSGVHHKGRIFACDGRGEGGIEILSSSDVIDTFIGTNDTTAGYYNASGDTSNDGDNIKYIQTMIAADETREIVGVYLDLADTTTVYEFEGTVKPNEDPLPYSITPLWANEDCTQAFGNLKHPVTDKEIVLTIPSGNYSSAKTTIRVPNYVRSNYRIQMIVIDPNALSVEGQNCLDGSTSGNYDQLAQCVNSEVQYKLAFGQDAWDRCGIDSGKPCRPFEHGAANPGDPSYDPATDYIYVNPLGCYMCTFNIQPVCSKDNFAIRPKAFDVNISDGDIFVSGENVNLKFEAENWNDLTPTNDYNETEDTSFTVDINITDDTKNCQVTVELKPLVQFADGIEIGDFYFNDIGTDLNFTVSETNASEYALVDYDDTDDIDRFITPLERNITVIPDLFEINATLTDHNIDTNFTYLHDINYYDSDDNYEMGAELNISIYALGADGNITRNYMETCYAKDTNITLVLSGTSITYPGSQPLEYFLYYNPEEDNGTTDSGEGNYTLPDPVANTITLPSLPIENVPSTFPDDAPEGNGTTQILYKLNFDRKQNLVVNPFQIVLTDVNITEIDTTVPPTDLVTGDTGTLSDQNATMYYARTRASKFFYEDINESSVITPILIDIYCDLVSSACDALGIDTPNAEIEDPDWWLSLGHNETTQNDGNITLIITLPAAVIEGNGTPIVDTDVTVDSLGKDDSISVTSNATKLPMTVIIDLNETNPTDTNHWLIYNPKDAVTTPTPFYKVRFIGDANWTGEGQTGHVIELEASYKKSQRVDW